MGAWAVIPSVDGAPGRISRHRRFGRCCREPIVSKTGAGSLSSSRVSPVCAPPSSSPHLPGGLGGPIGGPARPELTRRVPRAQQAARDASAAHRGPMAHGRRARQALPPPPSRSSMAWSAGRRGAPARRACQAKRRGGPCCSRRGRRRRRAPRRSRTGRAASRGCGRGGASPGCGLVSSEKRPLVPSPEPAPSCPACPRGPTSRWSHSSGAPDRHVRSRS